MLLPVLRRFLRPYRRDVVVVVLLQFLQTIAALSLPSLNADVIDNGVVAGDTAYIMRVGGVMLAVSGWLQWQGRFAPCPVDPLQRDACMRVRKTSQRVYLVSVVVFAIGGWFAFVQPLL